MDLRTLSNDDLLRLYRGVQTQTGSGNNLVRKWTDEELQSAFEAERNPPRRLPPGEVAADYTGLEPPAGQQGGARPDLREDFRSLVPSQREAGEPLRPTFEAVGGAIGGLTGLPLAAGAVATGAGAPMAPLIPIATGAMGAHAGSSLYDIYRDARRGLGLDIESSPPTTKDRLVAPLEAAGSDAAWGTAVGALPRVGAAVRGGVRRLMGVGPEQAEVARNADALGVPLGVSDLGENYGRTYVKTFGQLPWIGGPARTNRDAKIAGYERAADNYLDAFGPGQTVPELGESTRRGVEAGYDAFRTAASHRYDAARDLADRAGPIFDTGPLQGATVNLLTNILKEGPVLQSGARATSFSPEFTGRVATFLEQVDQFPARIGVKEVDWFDRELNNILTAAKKDGLDFSEVNKLRNVVRDTIRSSAHPAARALTEADDFFKRGLDTFETATAQKTARIDRNLFKVGKDRPGLLNDDELFSIVSNARSPKAIDQLENMLAHDQSASGRAEARTLMGALARRYVDESLRGARAEGKAGQEIIDVNVLEKTLKLKDPKSAEYQTMARLFRSAGQDINDFKRFVEITRAVYGNEVPDVSSFMARRLALGGSAVGALVGTHLAGMDPTLSAPLALLLGRYGSKVMTDPVKLRTLIKTYDSNLPAAQKRMSIVRMLQGLGGEARETQEAAETLSR